MIAIIALALTAAWAHKIERDEIRWLKSRMDYWYEQSRFWRELWEAERTGDYDRLREIQELRKMEREEPKP